MSILAVQQVDYSDDDFSWLPSRQPQWQALKSTPIPVEQVAVAAPAYTLRYRDMLGLLKCVQVRRDGRLVCDRERHSLDAPCRFFCQLIACVCC